MPFYLFRLIYFQTFPVTGAADAVNALRRLSREDFAIIYLTEDVAAEILKHWLTMISKYCQRLF